MPTIYPRCRQDRHEIYIDSEGYVFPCCWLGNFPDRLDYFEFHKNMTELINIKNHSMNEILQSDTFKSIEQSWTSPTPFSGCIKFCSKFVRTDLNDNNRKQGTNDMLATRLNRRKE
jgi:MoaA/NifB/PqqE/SkfB family radical SAM enzyme